MRTARLVAAVSITALVGVLLFSWGVGGPPSASSDEAVAPQLPDTATGARVPATLAPEPVDANTQGAAPVGEVTAPDGLTVCGRSYPVLGAPGATLPEPAASAPLGAPVHLVPFLRRMPGPEAQAMALLVEKAALAEPIWLGFGEAASACNLDRHDCLRAQFDRITAQMAESGRPATDRLARLAADHGSPAVYAMAVSACRSPDNQRAPAAHCQLLSPERWAQLDPDNLLAWLHLAEAAQGRGDSAAIDAALDRATLARRSGVETPAWAQQAVDILARLPEADRGALAMLILPNFPGTRWGAVRPLLEHCDADARHDERRRRQCELLAEKVLEHHADHLERLVAIELGSRLGWPADRIAALRSENEVLSASDSLLREVATGQPEPEGCGYWQRGLDRRLRSMAIGEVAAAREAVAATGLSPQQIVARHQARLSALGLDRAPPLGASAPSAGASGTSAPP